MLQSLGERCGCTAAAVLRILTYAPIYLCHLQSSNNLMDSGMFSAKSKKVLFSAGRFAKTWD